MANVDSAYGFEPRRHYGGGDVRHNAYNIASGLAANIAHGDPVKSTGTGKNITLAAAGEAVIGVFDGCSYVDPVGNRIFTPYWITGTTIMAGTEVTAYVYDDPDIEFSIQASGAIVAADIRNTADFVAGTPNAATRRSTYELDSANIGQGNLRIMGLDPVYAGNEYGTNAKVLVLFNEHELKAVRAGV